LGEQPKLGLGNLLLNRSSRSNETGSGLECFDKEAFGGLGIARRAQEKLERVAFRVNGSVEVRPRSFDLDVGFIDAPGVSGGFEVRPAAFLQFGGIVLHPGVDRRVIDVQPTFLHHFL